MNDLVLSLVGYIGGDILALILTRLNFPLMIPVSKMLLKEVINFMMDKDGNVKVKEKSLFRTKLRDPTEDELKNLSLIKRLSENQR